jgi:hypothetical protein
MKHVVENRQPIHYSRISHVPPPLKEGMQNVWFFNTWGCLGRWQIMPHEATDNPGKGFKDRSTNPQINRSDYIKVLTNAVAQSIQRLAAGWTIEESEFESW